MDRHNADARRIQDEVSTCQHRVRDAAVHLERVGRAVQEKQGPQARIARLQQDCAATASRWEK